jgi:diguanylate cyclase (GGDEF)-like protein
VALIAYRLALLIVRPLDRLTAGAAEVARGDLAVDLPAVSGGGEVAYLTRVFNDMVARLKDGQAELRNKNEELARLSITDSLTGLFNRRHLMEAINVEASRSRRNERPFAILMIDVDAFKEYNDTHGHQAGDEVLVQIASILQEVTRDVDTVSRYGGEEFLLLLPETNQNAAIDVAERIREQLKSHAVDGEAVTVSIGVAEFPIDGDGPSKVIAAADAALYRAKREGRDVVVRAQPIEPRKPRLRKA